MSAINTSEHTLLQTYPQKSMFYLGVQLGTTIVTATVSGSHAQGATTINLANVAGDTTELILGMTVQFSQSPGGDPANSAMFISLSGNTLTIGPNDVTMANGYYVTILDTFQLWRVKEGTFANQEFKPWAIAGPPRAGFTGEALNFVGIDSYSPLGRAVSSPDWRLWYDYTVISGSQTAFNTPSSPLVVSWATAGEKRVRLRCQDSAGELSGPTFRPVLIYDRTGANAPYQAFTIANCRGSREQGWSADFTVYGVADRSAFPDGGVVVLWAEDWYGTTKQTIGGAHRGTSEIVFTGYIRRGSVRVGFAEQSVTFTAESIDNVMRSLSMPSFTFRATSVDYTGGVTAPRSRGVVTAINVVVPSLTFTEFGTGRSITVWGDGNTKASFNGRPLQASDISALVGSGCSADYDPNSFYCYRIDIATAVQTSTTLNTNNWHTMSPLTTGHAVCHILQKHTSIGRMADVFMANWKYEVTTLQIPAGNLYDQLQGILTPTFGYVAGSRFGTVTLMRDRNIILSPQRGQLWPASIELTKDDWISLEITESATNKTALVELSGVYGNDKPATAKYPVHGAAHEGAIDSITGLIFINQAQANNLSKQVFARDNRRFEQIKVSLPNYRILEPAFSEWFTVVLDPADNNRGLDWTGTFNGIQGHEFFVTSEEFHFFDGYMMVDIVGVESVWGINGLPWSYSNPPNIEDSPGYSMVNASVIPGSFHTTQAYSSLGQSLVDANGNIIYET